MSTLREIVIDFEQELTLAGISDGRLSVQWIVEEVLGLRRAQIISSYPQEVLLDDEQRMRRLVSRRRGGEPIQYVVGNTDFMGSRIEVGRGVLIPRPETEELVEHVLDFIPIDREFNALDIGTGSGCIPIAIAIRRPRCRLTAIDISETAVEYAVRNTSQNDVSVRIYQADSTATAFVPSLGRETYDLVVTNPPYIGEGEKKEMQPEVRDYEPHSALFSGQDGTRMFEASAGNIYDVLKPGGRVYAEIHSMRASHFVDILTAIGFEGVEVRNDMQRRPRILVGSKPNGRPA